jgi:5-methylcytosine-specific restriction endonuclease McrA
MPLLKTTRLSDRVAKRKKEEANWRQVCRLIEIRDGFFCRPCGRKVTKTLTVQPDRLEHHHVKPRSLGGKDEVSNVCIICLSCHTDRHVTRTLSIIGNADATLTFERDGLEWHG